MVGIVALGAWQVSSFRLGSNNMGDGLTGSADTYAVIFQAKVFDRLAMNVGQANALH